MYFFSLKRTIYACKTQTASFSCMQDFAAIKGSTIYPHRCIIIYKALRKQHM